MLWNRKKQYGVCIGQKSALLCRHTRGHLHILADVSVNGDDPDSLGGLFADFERGRGEVGLVYPLSSFEVVTVSVPPVPREAVSRVLPFNLAKILQAPLQDYIYDWQVVQTFKDRHELSVYLFPAVHYNRIKQELDIRQKEIGWFEPDVFSAAACLESSDDPVLKKTVLIVLVWERSISFAVYEDGGITLTRSVDVDLPIGTPTTEMEQATLLKSEIQVEDDQEGDDGELPEFIAVVEEDDPETNVVNELGDPFKSDKADSILAGFDLFEQNDQQMGTGRLVETNVVSQLEQKKETMQWSRYIQNLVLEMVRTGDYHQSVLKGSRVTDVIIGGAERFFEELVVAAEEGQSFVLHPFPEVIQTEGAGTIMAGLCKGVLNR